MKTYRIDAVPTTLVTPLIHVLTLVNAGVGPTTACAFVANNAVEYVSYAALLDAYNSSAQGVH
jgi:hypothetical protein